MSNIRKVKTESFIESQIPNFLAEDSPLLKEFLNQYYISLGHPTGTLDLSNNITDFKDISTYSSERLYTLNNECRLVEDVLSFDDEITVNSTLGFPDKYGLIKIDNEIITYTGITTNTFTGCIRAFSGVTDINDTQDSSGLIFSPSEANEHISNTTVYNLNLIFYEKLFEKFKAHYLPDFEKRKFNPKIDLELVLSRARDFYLTKGTDTSYRILFEILYDDAVTIFRPQEYIIKPSDKQFLVTKNILVELFEGVFNSDDYIGSTITQQLKSGVTASAAIYNIEYRIVDSGVLYEISLDSESFFYDFESTKKTVILEKLENALIVDSTIGFEDSGTLYVKIYNVDGTFTIDSLTYEGKTINEFLNVSDISTITYDLIKTGDELIEDSLLEIISNNDEIIKFRLINVIGEFDYSNTNMAQVGDKIFLSSFGENYSDRAEFTSWIYNYPTYHDISSTSSSGQITLKDSVKFVIGEELELIDEAGVSITTSVEDILDSNRIAVVDDDLNSGQPKIKIRKIISKSSLNTNQTAFIQNSYSNETDKTVTIAATGLPVYEGLTNLNYFSFNLVGIGGTIFSTTNSTANEPINHNLLTGTRIYLKSNNSGIATGQFYVKKVSDTSMSLYKSTGDLYLSYSSNPISAALSNPITVPVTSNKNTIGLGNDVVGLATIFGYHTAYNGFSNQLLLKEFKVEDSSYRNKVTSSSQIYTIEDAYNAFS